MQQYLSVKAKYPNALLLFRVGDFYETFGEDAITTSKVLGIVLTQRKNGAASHVELAGFPHHALDTYLPKLVRAGYRVAICDQLEDPKLTKNIVKRGVTELVTPGVSFNEQILDNKANNFLGAVHFDKGQIGVSFLDISTGEFLVAEGEREYIEKLLQGFAPSEVLYQRNHEKKLKENFPGNYYTYRLEDWVYTLDFAREKLLGHFKTTSLKGFGVDEFTSGLIAAGAALHYLSETHNDKVAHISRISRIEENKYVWLDKFTIRNLELLDSAHADGKSLLQVLDKTISPMGGRMLRRWLVLPLKDIAAIEMRHKVVEFLKDSAEFAAFVSASLSSMGDVERLISRVSVGKANPRELLQLARAMRTIGPLKSKCTSVPLLELQNIGESLNDCSEMCRQIEETLHEEASTNVGKGNVIKSGVHQELDELRNLSHSGKKYLLEIQQREQEKTGISSLKISYNNVFGYYLEVRNTHRDKVPAEWVRKQTLVNAERYITSELKEYETKILGAEEKILELENSLYQKLLEDIGRYTQPVQQNARTAAEIDCLLSFANLSVERNYVRPELDDSGDVEIEEGRHPVIEAVLPPEEQYVSNSVKLNREEQQILMITGPNMSGKSALLRQTALITIMAQIGCFVPAARARIGIVDKVFTRVGASDNISSGESTFMVEMNETASILNNLTDRSLILLDEIGRGTSTYDGISIAWAIAEFIHENPKARAKTLFATHYHELNDMANMFERIVNFNVAVKEVGNKVIFLRKLTPGGSEHSFGIHVARMAGMPKVVIKRANEVLHHLEQSHVQQGKKKNGDSMPARSPDMQLSFFQLDDPVLQQIRDDIATLNIDTLTPVEALMKLNEIKKLTGG